MKFWQDIKSFGAGICKHHAKLWGSHSSVSEDSSLQGCDTVSGGKWLPMFWKTAVSSASQIKHSKKNSYYSQTTWPLKMKAAHSFEMSRTKHPMTLWHHIRPETSHTQQHTHFCIIHTTSFNDLWKQWTVLLATPLHLVQVKAVQIIVPRVTAATAKHKNLQHTIFSVPATLSLLCPPAYHKQKHPTSK
jgi:hypothetical protein